MNARPPRPGASTPLTALALSLLCATAAGVAGCASDRPGYRTAGGRYGETDRKAGTRPLDPLSSAERETARRAALADPRVREILDGEPHRVVSVDFVADKGRSGEVVRSAEVLLYNPERDIGVRALVRLAEANVTSVERVPGRRVPLTIEDYQLARELALRSQEVRRLYGGGIDAAQIEMLRELPADRDDPCSRNRCVFLLFRLPEGYASGPRVVVDLTAREVRVRGERR